MTKRVLHILLLLLLVAPAGVARSQELFIETEPASTMPKGVIGARAFSQAYREPGNQTRALEGLRLMYGLSSKLTLMANATVSNHHSKQLPAEFPDHNTPQIGVPLPWRFNGVNIYGKYRFYAHDGEKTHFRMAAYGSASWLDVAHDHAEPQLLDDTKGVGGGIIATYLKKHFAVSFTGGFILPANYHGDVPDMYPSLPQVPAEIKYGKAVNYSLSFGYLLLPFKYSGYSQTNINVYAEFIGKSYQTGQVFFENIGIPGAPYKIGGLAAKVFAGESYVEVHPGIQAIIRSNLRIDLSAAVPLINRSYVWYYPVFMLGIQRYFYR